MKPKTLLGIWNQKGSTQNLFQELPGYELKDEKPLIETTIALKNECFHHRILTASETMQPLFGQSCLAYIHSHWSEAPPLYATESMAVAYVGVIDNFREMREILLSLGYSFKTQTDGEILLRSISRYLEIRFISPIMAIRTVIKRLQGEFAIMVLFAKEKCLVVARSGYPLVIGTNNDMVYVSTDTQMLTRVLLTKRQIEEGEPVLLR